VAWIYRAITQMRARELKARKIEYVPNPDFALPGADEEIVDHPDALRPYKAEAHRLARVPRDLPPYLQQLYYLPLLAREGEAALFRKMNYLKYQADRRRAQIDPETTSAAELDRIERLLDQAQEVKKQITQANLRLVVSIAKRHLGPELDFFEIISDGNVSLMRAVDKFDYGRGFKFSTYASWAIMRNYARLIPERRYQRDRYQTGREELLENVIEPHVDEHDEDHALAIRGALERMLATLEQRERTILRRRFGLDEYGQAETLEQIGRHFGVSKERIRQLESRAIGKLRTDFEADAEKLLGM
jgi:RNA polymerase primary sigma factor